MKIVNYILMAIQDYFLGKVKQDMQQPSTSPIFQKGMEADAAFLTPFFNMPTTTDSGVMRTADDINGGLPGKGGTGKQTPATKTGGIDAPVTPPAETGGVLRPGETVEERNARLGFGPKTDPTIEEKFGIEDTGKTEKDMFSMFGVDSTDPNSLYGKFGITQPDYNAPDSQEYKDLQAEQKKLGDVDRRERLQKYYEDEVKRIEGDYQIRREQLGVDVENARNERVSSLYDVGVVNPLSSGLASIGTASDKYQREQENLLNQKEATEKQLAYASFFDMETEEIERRIESINASIKSHEENAKAEYQQQVDEFGRGVQLVDKLIGVWKENNRVSEKEREEAQGAFNDLVKNFGSAAFNGMESTDLAEMEAALGYPAGSLQSGITELKKNELRDKPMDLRTIGGSLYNIERDADGNIVPTLIISKPVGGGSGGGSSATDKNLKAMFKDAGALLDDLGPKGSLEWDQAYNRIARQYPEFNVPDSSGKTVIDDALGGSAGYDPKTGTFDPSKATGFAKQGKKNDYKLSSEQVTRYYSAAYDSEKKKVDTSKIPENVRNEVIERYGSDVNPPATKDKKW